MRPERSHRYIALLRVLFKTHPKKIHSRRDADNRPVVSVRLDLRTYTLVLGKFYGVPASSAPWYLIAFAVGNFIGPLVLGPLFDTIGRRKMISGTYILSGILLTALT